MSSDAFNPKLLLSSLFLTGYLACMTPGFATEAPQTPTEQEAALLLAADAEANKRFNEAWQAYRKGRIATLENLGATLEAHPLGDYPNSVATKPIRTPTCASSSSSSAIRGSTLENNPHPTI